MESPDATPEEPAPQPQPNRSQSVSQLVPPLKGGELLTDVATNCPTRPFSVAAPAPSWPPFPGQPYIP